MSEITKKEIIIEIKRRIENWKNTQKQVLRPRFHFLIDLAVKPYTVMNTLHNNEQIFSCRCGKALKNTWILSTGDQLGSKCMKTLNSLHYQFNNILFDTKKELTGFSLMSYEKEEILEVL